MYCSVKKTCWLHKMKEKKTGSGQGMTNGQRQRDKPCRKRWNFSHTFLGLFVKTNFLSFSVLRRTSYCTVIFLGLDPSQFKNYYYSFVLLLWDIFLLETDYCGRENKIWTLRAFLYKFFLNFFATVLHPYIWGVNSQ